MPDVLCSSRSLCWLFSLLQNSALITRYATLRVQALGQTPKYELYGNQLKVDTSATPYVITGTGTDYEKISEMELRLSGTMGVEVSIQSNPECLISSCYIHRPSMTQLTPTVPPGGGGPPSMAVYGHENLMRLGSSKVLFEVVVDRSWYQTTAGSWLQSVCTTLAMVW